MKVVITKQDAGDYEESQSMTIDGKQRLSVGPLCECPEDAIIGRDLVSCEDIANFMRLAYDAAKNGERLTIEVVEGEI